MSVSNYAELAEHAGHQIEVVTYGDPAVNVATECVTCSVVLLDFDRPTLLRCFYCKAPLRRIANGIYVDSTDGDCCWGDDNLVNENEPHTPGASCDSCGKIVSHTHTQMTISGEGDFCDACQGDDDCEEI